jgi:hypothetical protein
MRLNTHVSEAGQFPASVLKRWRYAARVRAFIIENLARVEEWCPGQTAHDERAHCGFSPCWCNPVKTGV